MHCSGTGANGLECEPVSALGGDVCVPFSMIKQLDCVRDGKEGQTLETQTMAEYIQEEMPAGASRQFCSHLCPTSQIYNISLNTY